MTFRCVRLTLPGSAKRFMTACSVAVLAMAASVPAFGWKPQTHIYAANQATSLLMSGQDAVEINGQQYQVDTRVAQSIRNWPSFYRAGVIGPDGYPDIYVGQSCIHPDTRGNNGLETPNMGNGASYSYEWLRHVYQAGWNYYNAHGGDASGQKILAFTYGFLTHAAGDMWAHSFVNDFASGVFPSVTELNLLPIGVRHIVVESYIGAATPATDLTIPGSSAELSEFIYSTLMAHEGRGGFVDTAGNDAKDLGRGGIFNFFFDLRDTLRDEADFIYDYLFFDPVALGVAAYCEFWIDDIDDGLAAWPTLSMGISQDLFQNSDFDGAKELVGDFVFDHLLSMIGTPDSLVLVLEVFNAVMSLFDPLIEPLADEALKFVNYMIEQATGIDLLEMKEYFLTPENHINNPAIGLGPNTSATLDSLMGRTTPGTGSFNPNTFAPMKNTITLSKMVLLSPEALNQVLYDNRVGNLYEASVDNSDKEDVMLGFIHTLDGHQQWRKSTTVSYQNSPAGTHLGEGMLIWRDCLARDRMFRTLFTDWQNGNQNFPALGEAGEDLSNTPPPNSTLAVNGPIASNNGKTYVGNSTTFTVNGQTNHFWYLNEITAQGQYAPGGTLQSALSSVNVGPIVGPDGDYTVSFQGIGNCTDGPNHPGILNQKVYTLDQTPPTITVPVPNQNQSFDVNQTFVLDFNATDAGSGVQTLTATFDGVPISDLSTIDAFLLNAGDHTIVVTATDQIGNQATYTRTFGVHATILGLKAAVTRAYSEHLIVKPVTANALQSILDTAQKSFLKNDRNTAKNKIASARDLIAGQLGSGVDTAFGNRFIGWCNDLIARL